MAIKEHPHKGCIVMCDFNKSFIAPEMQKRRPVIVLSPKIRNRHRLCTVVALSNTPPEPQMPYHMEIELPPALPQKLREKVTWVKGDMVYSISFDRLNLISLGKDKGGKRCYHYKPIEDKIFRDVQACVLRGMGLSGLTKHLKS